jgi:hypothetical protein
MGYRTGQSGVDIKRVDTGRATLWWNCARGVYTAHHYSARQASMQGRKSGKLIRLLVHMCD